MDRRLIDARSRDRRIQDFFRVVTGRGEAIDVTVLHQRIPRGSTLQDMAIEPESHRAPEVPRDAAFDTIAGMTAPMLPPSSMADVEVRADERALVVRGQTVSLGARAFDLFEFLLENRDRTLTKAEIFDRVWANVVVEENNLQVQISTLRKSLGAKAIATIPGRGYKFVLPRAAAPTTEAGAEGRAAAAPRAPASPSPSNLPPLLAPLYGRAGDVAAVRELVSRHSVVTIVGAGGIGKTRLAQAVASGCDQDFPDGIWWIELASLADPSFVPTALARVVGASGSESRGPLQTLMDVLASRQALIVVDNCEHLADAVADIVDAIVGAAPRVRILLTSQEPLRTSSEHLYRLGPLVSPNAGDPMPAAVDGAALLFIERARALDPRFEVNATRWPAIAEICRRLDGIPLAVEMAAARLPLLGLEGVRQRLDARFQILTGNARTVLRRHQTLRATLDWSHSLLSAEEQAVLRRLGVFAGTFSLESAERVASDAHLDPFAALDHLAALVDKSLVMAEGGDMPRYRLLETTRAYALERLGEAGETGPMLRRHGEALRDLLLEWDLRGVPLGKADRLAFGAELDNLRAALDWARGETNGSALAVELASLSLPIWQASVTLHEGIETLLSMVPSIGEATPDIVKARFWKTIARLGTVTARRECFEAAGRAVELYRRLGDVDSLFEALLARVAIGSERGESDAAAEALAEAEPHDNDAMAPHRRAGMAWARQRLLSRADRNEEAMQAVMLQAEHYRRQGSAEYAAIAEGSNVASYEILLGRPHSAEARSRHALTVLDTYGAARDGGHIRSTLAVALMEQGRLDEAIDESRRAFPLLLAEGDEFRLLEPLALMAALQGRTADAARVLGYADRHRAGNGAVRTPAQQRRRDQAATSIAASMSEQENLALQAEGSALAHAAAFAHAFGDA